MLKLIEDVIRKNHTETAEGYELDVHNVISTDQVKLLKAVIDEDGDDCVPLTIENEDIRKSLYSMIENDDIDSKLNFADRIMDAIKKYYYPVIQEMINDEIGWVEKEDMEDRGMKKITYPDSGETRWV